jgi:hypothetical protein
MANLLDLAAAIEDDNFEYTIDVSVPETDDIDYLINCRKHFNAEDDMFTGGTFSFKKVNELRDGFEDMEIKSYIFKGHRDRIGGDDVFRHEIEIQVVE